MKLVAKGCLISLATGVALVIGGCFYILSDHYEKFADFDCGANRHIRVNICHSFEYSTGDYEVWEGRRRVVGPSSMHLTESELRRMTLYALQTRDGSIAVVLAKERPYEIFVLHDFVSGDSWPRLDGDYGSDRMVEGWRRRQAMRERLEADHPEISFTAMLRDHAYLSARDSLDLSDTRVTGPQLAVLTNYPGIVSLDLSNTPFSNDDMAHLRGLTNLICLRLWYTAVTDEGLAQLRDMKALRRLILWNTAITEAGLRHLEGLPELAEIELPEDIQYTDAGVAALSRIPALKYADLDRAQISDESLTNLLALTHIWSLELRDTGVSDKALEVIERIPTIGYLLLDGARITDAGLDHLVRLKELSYLSLSRTAITDAGLQKLAALPKLGTLHVDETAVTPAAITNLKTARPGLTIYN
jgi:hypothetical protein